jgi:hypothetical protein
LINFQDGQEHRDRCSAAAGCACGWSPGRNHEVSVVAPG